MVRHCCVVNCKSVWSPNLDISFHSFPFKNENLLMKWIEIIPTKGKVGKHTYICSEHFLNSDYNSDLPYRLKCRLKSTAVPSKFVIDRSKVVLEKVTCNEVEVKKEIDLPSKGVECSIRQSENVCSSKKDETLHRKIKILQSRLRRRESKLENIQSLIKILEKKVISSDKIKHTLHQKCSDSREPLQMELSNNIYTKNKKHV